MTVSAFADMNVHGVARIRIKRLEGGQSKWLILEFIGQDGESGFTVTAFGAWNGKRAGYNYPDLVDANLSAFEWPSVKLIELEEADSD